MTVPWMQANLAKLRQEAANRPMSMPGAKPKHDDSALIAEYLANGGKVTRVPCTGRKPAGAFGRKVGPSHNRAGLTLNPISERAAREKVWGFHPKGILRLQEEARRKAQN